MTINRLKNKKLNSLIIFFGVFLLAISVGNVFVYNQTVNWQLLIKNKEKELRGIRFFNAELKNQIYKILDVKNITESLKARGLVKIKNPDYLKIDDAVSIRNINN